jgi:serine-type D-Ala-D-Ala carboxypeptidase/endopeptidase (penicillin-binding protein 4)
MRKLYIIMTALCGLLLQMGCSSSSRIPKRKIAKQFGRSAILNDHFTGFALYDLDNKKMIWQQNADKYFTPASNTKLFTFYACLKMLGDSIPALKYVVKHDSLIFWGTGDPSFLHSDLKATKALNFLKNSEKKLFFASNNYTGDFYGDGWAWNDYNDYYQAEINELPIADNMAEFYADKNDSLQVRPAYMKRFLKVDSNYHPKGFRVQRDFVSNSFVCPATKPPKDFVQDVPWKTGAGLTLALLQDTLKLPVTEIQLAQPDSAKTLYDSQADTVYRHMLQPSDNFMAEQLLLVCSSAKYKTLNTDSTISYAKANFLNDLPDVPQWADGSGLSRQNLFTPRSMIVLLEKIRDQVKNDTLLHSLLPEGGVVGTIRHAYKTDNGQPFIWAKTGSLNNVYNQSGYFTTRRGKHLAFVFMNNNFTRPTSEVRNEMVRIVTWVRVIY